MAAPPRKTAISPAGGGLGRAVGSGIGLDTANEITRDIGPVDKKRPEYVRADQCICEIDLRIRSQGPNQVFHPI
jgi:hypothetical protein